MQTDRFRSLYGVRGNPDIASSGVQLVQVSAPGGTGCCLLSAGKQYD